MIYWSSGSGWNTVTAPVAGVRLRDRVAGRTADVYGRVVINATGAWAGQVAALAGLPPEAIRRARAYLQNLESGRSRGQAPPPQGELPLFQAAAASTPDISPSKLEEALRAFNPDAMTPKEAIEALYRLRALLEDDA